MEAAQERAEAAARAAADREREAAGRMDEHAGQVGCKLSTEVCAACWGACVLALAGWPPC